MNRQEHLLTILTEECAEVAQRATKAMRFGMDEIQPGQGLTNKERMILEVNDLFAVLSMLEEKNQGISWVNHSLVTQKKRKVEEFRVFDESFKTYDEALPRFAYLKTVTETFIFTAYNPVLLHDTEKFFPKDMT